MSEIKKTEAESRDNHVRVFRKVMAIPKKKMSHAEKIMFCYILSVNLTGKPFDWENRFIAKYFGDSEQSITDYVTRLFEMGIIHINYTRDVRRDGTYHGTKRSITVIDIDGWTKKELPTPSVKLIPKKNSKANKEAKKMNKALAEALTPAEATSVPINEKTKAVETTETIENIEVVKETKMVLDITIPEAKPPQPEVKNEVFDVNIYLTKEKLDWFNEQKNKNGLTVEVLKRLTKKQLDNLFYGDDNVFYIKNFENHKEFLCQNIHGIYYYCPARHANITLYIKNSNGAKTDFYQLKEVQIDDCLQERGIEFGGFTHDYFITLKQYRQTPVIAY